MSEDRELVDPTEDPWAVPPKAFSFDGEPPISIEGDVVAQEMAQQVDFDTKKPLTWDDGRPRKKVIVTLQTELREDENDDGLRQLHVRIPSALRTSISEAMREAGKRQLVGNHLATTYTKDGPQTPAEVRAKRTPPKEYESLVSDALSERPI